jgi:hypothetical protein
MPDSNPTLSALLALVLHPDMTTDEKRRRYRILALVLGQSWAREDDPLNELQSRAAHDNVVIEYAENTASIGS